MAKFEMELHGDFDQTLEYFHDGILDASMSASFEDESCWQREGVRCCIRVYERYSFGGGNRVSMALTLAGDGKICFCLPSPPEEARGCYSKSTPGARRLFWIPSESWQSGCFPPSIDI